MRSALPFLALVLFLTHTAYSQTNSTTLEPGTAVERTISKSESHTYTITLGDQEYLQFAVFQRGIDLIVRVTSQTGQNLGDFDTPNGNQGPENVSIVAVSGGIYQIVVAPLDPRGDGDGGTYEIKTLEIRPATDQELKVAKGDEDRRLKGMALLNDLVDAMAEIRLPQTRIRLKLRTAVLLWSVDKKRASELLTEGVNDIKDYMATLNQDDEAFEPSYYAIQQLRFEACQMLASNDPEEALSLLRSSRPPSLDPNRSRGDQEQEQQFELSLASQIATRNPKRAYELAEESLKTGYSSTLVRTLSLLTREDPDLASSLSKSIMSKLLQDKLLTSPEASELAMGLIRNSSVFLIQKTGPPLLSSEDFKALVRKVVNESLAARPTRDDLRKGNWATGLLIGLRQLLGDQLDSVVPGASAAIQKKLTELGPEQPWQAWQRVEDSMQKPQTPEAIKESINNAPPEARSMVVQQLIERKLNQGDLTQAKQLILDNILDPRAKRQALNNLEREAALNDFRMGRIDEAFKHLARVEPAAERANIITQVTSSIGSGQKRAQALNYLETARSFLGGSIQAEAQPQMNALINLAGAFSRYDAKRGFEILDPLVDQFNELSQAAKTLNGFGPLYFIGGELSLLNGNALADIANPLSTTLGTLSLTDFDRAKLTADRLVLPEVRFATYLGIAQQAIMPNGVYSPTVAYVNSRNR